MSDFKLDDLVNSQLKESWSSSDDNTNTGIHHFETDLKQLNETSDLIEQMIKQNSSMVPSNTPIQSPKSEKTVKTSKNMSVPESRVLDFDNTSPQKGNISMNEVLIKSQPTRIEDLKFHELFASYSPTRKPNTSQENPNYTYGHAASNTTSSSHNMHNASYMTSMEDISAFGILDNPFGSKQYQTPTKSNKDLNCQFLTLDEGFNSARKLKADLNGKTQADSPNYITHALLLPQFPSSPISRLTCQFPEPRPLEEIFEIEDLASRNSTPEPNFTTTNAANLAFSLEQNLTSNKRKLKELQRTSAERSKLEFLQSNSDDNILPLSKKLKHSTEPSKLDNIEELSSAPFMNMESSLPASLRSSKVRFNRNVPSLEEDENLSISQDKEVGDVLRSQRRALRNISKKKTYEINPIQTTSSPFSEWVSSSPSRASSVKKKTVTLPSLTAEGMVKRNPNTSRTIPRSKNGCWTCRIRKKKCSENKPWCDQCERLGLNCDGYSVEKPDFFEDPGLKRKKLDLIKAHTMKIKKEQLQQRMDAGKSKKKQHSGIKKKLAKKVGCSEAVQSLK